MSSSWSRSPAVSFGGLPRRGASEDGSPSWSRRTERATRGSSICSTSWRSATTSMSSPAFGRPPQTLVSVLSSGLLETLSNFLQGGIVSAEPSPGPAVRAVNNSGYRYDTRRGRRVRRKRFVSLAPSATRLYSYFRSDLLLRTIVITSLTPIVSWLQSTDL